MEAVKIAEKPHKCAECDNRFSLKRSIPRHMKEQHSSERYQCVHCRQIFLNQGNYKVHFGRAHANDFLLYVQPEKIPTVGNYWRQIIRSVQNLKMIYFYQVVPANTEIEVADNKKQKQRNKNDRNAHQSGIIKHRTYGSDQERYHFRVKLWSIFQNQLNLFDVHELRTFVCQLNQNFVTFLATKWHSNGSWSAAMAR